MQTDKLNAWLNQQRISNKLKIKKKSYQDLKQWKFKEKLIHHKKNNFFSIRPFLFSLKTKKWFQPLIIQKEQGILGIIKKKIKDTNYYLLQSKIEPGNINGVQISPTVQATKSNYLRKHKGKKTVFLDYFLNKKNVKVLSSLKLSEQGSRFLDKKNKNILIEVNNFPKKLKKNFCWLTTQNIKYLISKKNIINMDTISVFSSVIKKNYFDIPINTKKDLKSKYDKFNDKFYLKRYPITFKKLKKWKITNFSIYDLSKEFFTIFFINVKANSREVKSWEQPIVSDHKISLNGFLTCKINKTTHYLLKIISEAGRNQPVYTSTISEKNHNFKSSKKLDYKSLFISKNYLLDIINSDEGGRFLKNETRNIICEVKDHKKIQIKDNFIWASHNQMIELISQNKMSIEARNLFASYNIDKIK